MRRILVNIKQVIIFLSIIFITHVQAMTLTKDSKMYVPIVLLSPGQIRFTQTNLDTKAAKLSRSKRQYDNGNSSIEAINPIPVVLGPDNLIVLVDSHHECMAAQKVGDTTVPVQVVDDLRHLNRLAFFKEAQANNYIYPFDFMGDLMPMPETGWYTWNQMQDDPNRLFAAFTAWKCSNGKWAKDPNATQDPTYPLWIKKAHEKVKIAFIEFKMATALYQAGLRYDYAWGTNPNDGRVAQFTEQARSVLVKALNEGRISPFDLIPEKLALDEIIKNQ
jgi:hypothetical protein